MCGLQLPGRKRFAVSHDEAIHVFEVENVPPDAERKPIFVLDCERAVLV
jgi:hypothetical protein